MRIQLHSIMAQSVKLSLMDPCTLTSMIATSDMVEGLSKVAKFCGEKVRSLKRLLMIGHDERHSTIVRIPLPHIHLVKHRKRSERGWLACK